MESIDTLSKQARRLAAEVLACGLVAGSLVGGIANAQSPQDKQLLLETLNRVEQLEEEVRQLRGDLEVYRHQQEDLERRLQAGGVDTPGPATTTRKPVPSYERPAPPPSSPPGYSEPAVTAPPVAPPPSRRENAVPPSPYAQPAPPPEESGAGDEAAYDEAFKRLQEGRYQEAISGFESFLKSHPSSKLAANAQYWLGEAYYVNRDFTNAKNAFLNLGVNYPNSDKLPDTLLKLGYVYDELGDKAKARDVLRKLIESYPNTQAASLADKRLRSMR